MGKLKMKTIILPDELNIEDSQPVQFFDYHSSLEINRQQITLTQNTFSFLTEGAKEVISDNSVLSIDNSKFLILKSGHCLMTEKLSQNKNYRSTILFFSNEILLKFIQKIKLNKTKFIKPKSIYSFEKDDFINQFVHSLLEISKLSKTTQKQLFEIKFEEIMLYLIEKYGNDFLLSLLENNNDSTQKFMQTIERNQLNKLTLNELAFLCNMSVSTFKRKFEKLYSESPIRWFQNKRLEHAHYLLNQKQQSSSEIYIEIGYESLSSFIQAYKTKYGVTPKQYQKMNF